MIMTVAMTNETKLIIEKARNLSAAEREDILEALLVTLHQDQSGETDQAWRELIDERLSEFDRGSKETFDFTEAVDELRSK